MKLFQFLSALLTLAVAYPVSRFNRYDNSISNKADAQNDLMFETEESRESSYVETVELYPLYPCPICLEPIGSNTTALEYCKNQCGKYVHAGLSLGL